MVEPASRTATPRSSTTSPAAGAELLAAYRAAVTGEEQRWTRGTDRPGTGTAGQRPTGPADGDEGPDRPGTEHIDLD